MELSKRPVLLGGKTHFSIGESIVEPEKLIETAAKCGYAAVAVADNMTINAMPVLFGKAKENAVKLIIGASIRVVDSLAWRKTDGTKNGFFVPKLYVKNEQGLVDLMWLLSRSFDEDHFYQREQVDIVDICEVFSKGNLICTSGDAYSVYSHQDFESIIEKIISAGSASDFVSELVPVHMLYYDRINDLALWWEELHRPDNKQLIVSRPILNGEGDTKYRNTLNCIINREKVTSRWRQEPATDLHVKRWSEIGRDLLDYLLRSDTFKSEAKKIFTQAMRSTSEFPDRFEYTWEKMPVSLPNMADDPFDELMARCKEGWKNRIGGPTLGYKPDESILPEYKKRLAYELGVLRKMGFENYFLLVGSLVNWCKDNDVMVGPGRGSVGGSLVAYLMGITDVDPLRFNLVFERFINPERLDLPDIDLDFMSSRRDEVIDHLVETYGAEFVAGIANYGTLGSSSSLRSVASAHGLMPGEFNCSKQVPKEHGIPISLEQAKEQVAEIERFAILNEEVWDEAVALQGVFRNMAKHAAGVIVAADPIISRAVVNTRDDLPIVNWDKRVVEDFGLIKLDVLGLQTLDLLHLVKGYVKELEDEDLNYTDLPLDDEEVMAAFGEGNTIGIFQFEGGGMRNLLKELAMGGALTFNDIVAATALFRPGPLESGLTDSYIQIRQGATLPSYPHSSMRPALEETGSVIVYQEQVMQVARDLAGFSMAEADKLRKAMGKKLPEEMAKMREIWVKGCIETSGLDRDHAGELFDLVQAFAGYGFNKSHSVEYTILSYWSMYAKIRHPAAFYAAALTILSEEKRTQIVKSAEKSGITIMPPDINVSSARFEIRKSGDRYALYAPFQLMKGLSEKGSAAIMEAKKAIGGEFKSKAEFIDTVNRRACNVRVQEALDKVGAFAVIEGQIDPLHPDRLRDQKIMLPGLMTGAVRVERSESITTAKIEKIRMVMEKVSLAGEALEADINAKKKKVDPEADPKRCLHPQPFIGKDASIMIVCEHPTWSEVEDGMMGEGLACEYLDIALKSAKISRNDLYITALVKCNRDKGETLTNAHINAYSSFLDEEIKIINPAIIIALGSKSIRHMMPDVKGGWEELLGQEHYDPGLDATIIFGMNPAMIHFDPAKQEALNDLFRRVAEISASFDEDR